MATSPQPAPAAAPERRESPRITLARAAADAALSHPAVTRLDSGVAGQHATFSGVQRLAGVTCLADGDRFAVALYVVAVPTDLHALASEIERSVREAAAAVDLASALGTVHIIFTDLTLPDETTRA